MTQPQVTITELDGQLGILPPSAGRLFALVGVAATGPINTPATFARIPDIRAVFTSGPLVEAAAYYIARFGRPVVLVRSAAATDGEVSNLFQTAGTTADADQPHVGTGEVGPTASDAHELYVKFRTDGAAGTAGITYQISYDGGRTVSAVRALGTSLNLVFEDAGVTLVFAAAADVLAGDTYVFYVTAPQWDGAGLGAALDALGASAAQWELVHIVGEIDADAFDAIELKLAAMNTHGNRHAWIGSVRAPSATTPGVPPTLIAETEAAYLTALTSAFASKSSKIGMLCAGACKLTSAVTGHKIRRPASYAIAALQASVSEEIDIADIGLGSLTGVSIRDANGNPDEHDESISPGLDDARFCVLRSWDGFSGVYCNRPRIFAPAGSDFEIMPHRRVLNLAHAALYVYFVRRLNKPILIDPTTGFILESERKEIELGAIAAMRSVLLAKPKASAVDFVLSATDNLLSTKTLTGDARVLPLAYPEFIDLSVGFVNPALQVQAA